MNPTQCNTFITLYETRSMSKASDCLFITTPAVKKQLDSLERDLQVVLFTRSRTGLTPTEAGTAFYQFCKRAIPMLDREVDQVRAIHGRTRGLVRIGYDNQQVYDPVFQYALFAFRRQYPQIQIDLEACDFFDRNRVDIFYGVCRTNQTDLSLHQLCTLPLSCIVNVDHPLAGRSSLSWTELAGYKLVLPPAELLQHAEPNKLILPEERNVHYSSFNDYYSSYRLYTLRDDIISVIIGFEEYITPLLVQIPLSDVCFPYYICTFNETLRPNVSLFLRFLQSFYPEKLLQLWKHPRIIPTASD